jgi:hypothetical protein
MSEHEDAITKAIRRADAFTNAATALQGYPYLLRLRRIRKMRTYGGNGGGDHAPRIFPSLP